MSTADIILATVVREHDAQRKRMENIDHKASTLLGFMITAAGIFGGLLVSGRGGLPHLDMVPTILLSLASLALGVAAVCFAACLFFRTFTIPDIGDVVKFSEFSETEENVAFAHARAYAKSLEYNEKDTMPDKQKWFGHGLWAFIITVVLAVAGLIVLIVN